jgi:hypothetical protein
MPIRVHAISREKNVCIERSAALRFHAGSSPISTAHMIEAYNARLRNYLNTGNYMNSSAFHTISGSDMISRFGGRDDTIHRRNQF